MASGKNTYLIVYQCRTESGIIFRGDLPIVADKVLHLDDLDFIKMTVANFFNSKRESDFVNPKDVICLNIMNFTKGI